MTKQIMARVASIILCLCVANGDVLAEQGMENTEFWPQWRGSFLNGTSLEGNTPVEWGEDRNIRWKIDIPGVGHASPIVWGDQVFVLTAVETDRIGKETDSRDTRRRGPPTVNTQYVHRFVIYAIDRKSGEINWQQTAVENLPHESTHPTGTWASNSPVTDGEHVYAYFGSQGLYCYDMQGSLQWKSDFGDMTIKLGFGEGSSPALHNDYLVINWDHERQSFLVALDKRTGKVRWKVKRDEKSSWSTPLIIDVNGSPQIITSATHRVRGNDLKTGALIWECGGMTDNVIPTPIANNGTLYVTSGFRGNALLAIRLSAAKGDITNSDAVLWRHDRDTPYTPSPLLYGNHLYFTKGNNGILTCLNAETGAPFYGPQRVEGMGDIYASPVGVDGRVYIVGRNGTTLVINHGNEYEVISRNVLDDEFSASPAIVGNEIYLRGRNALYCIAED